MKEIETREHIRLLVNVFYSKIRKDELLGPIFNHIIPENHWEIHLEKLTDFWETNLFGAQKFKGNPTGAHKKVDQAFNYKITQVHFSRWLHLWFTTIDELFVGELAIRAKNGARKMSTGQFIAMWSYRPENRFNPTPL